MRTIQLTDIRLINRLNLVKGIKDIYGLGLKESKEKLDEIERFKTLSIDLSFDKDLLFYSFLCENSPACLTFVEEGFNEVLKTVTFEEEANHWFKLLTKREKEYISYLKKQNLL